MHGRRNRGSQILPPGEMMRPALLSLALLMGCATMQQSEPLLTKRKPEYKVSIYEGKEVQITSVYRGNDVVIAAARAPDGDKVYVFTKNGVCIDFDGHLPRCNTKTLHEAYKTLNEELVKLGKPEFIKYE